MAIIYFVRHAESIANTKGIYQGITYDTDLSVVGRKQARALAKYFDKINIRQIISSPLKRTMQTADFIAKRKKLPIRKEKEIIETNHGDWEGKYKDVIQKTWPWIYKKWLKFPSRTKFPQGEHFLETQKRVIKWWQEFCEENIDDTLVVSHDNIIRVLVARILNKNLNKIWKFHLQPTAITKVNVARDNIILESLGESKHLGMMKVDLSVHAL